MISTKYMNSVLKYYRIIKENVEKERRRQTIQRGNHEKARSGFCSDQRI